MISNVVRSYVDNLTTDQYILDKGNRVTVTCEHRSPGAVVGILASPLQFGSTANYKTYEPIGTLQKVIDFVDAGVNLLGGASVQQPWFSRKYWVKTEPLKFSFTIAFIAQTDAKTEVFDKCVALVGYTYPRKLEGTDMLSLYATPGPNLFSGTVPNTDSKYYNDVVGAAKNLKNKLFGGSSGQAGPDSAGLQIGSVLSLKYCYIDSVQVMCSSALDPDGYPHYATATVNVTAFDTSFASTNGVFTLSQPQAVNLDVGHALDQVKAALPGGNNV